MAGERAQRTRSGTYPSRFSSAMLLRCVREAEHKRWKQPWRSSVPVRRRALSFRSMPHAMFYTAEALLASRDLTFSSHGAVHGASGKEFA
jgi:hypothetical protein